MTPKEIHHAPVVLQPRLIHIERHPVDALEFQSHMLIEDIGHGSR